jgi:predicted Kef-type K+ transport protein
VRIHYKQRCNVSGKSLQAPTTSSADWGRKTTMIKMLVLLVALTMAFGAAASVTISFAPAYADDAGKGY